MKKYHFTVLLAMLLSILGTKTFAHDIEAKNAEGVTIYYVWTNNNSELAVSCQGDGYYIISDEYSGNLIIPDSVTYNGKTYCVTSIDSYAFAECRGLTSVTLPNSVMFISHGAFEDCSGLTSVTITSNLNSIGVAAFRGCSVLTSLTIPNSVTNIGSCAFGECFRLAYVTIPNSVTSIGYFAFYGCTSLASITIPGSVTDIVSGAFKDCSNLTSVTVFNPIPVAISEDVFTNRANATLYVPHGCKETYLAADYWKEFKEIIEMDETGICHIVNTEDNNGTIFTLDGKRINKPRKGINIIGGKKVVVQNER
ncbi:MAG: leucine-rich repeat domain-containing protein [Prevotella sp.]|nr:leucine-rich repeat domain-containing protein [Prevotella sp.]